MLQAKIVCDSCNSEYTLPPEMELPPYWLVTHFAVANGEGILPNSEYENIKHFCSLDCLAEYCKGQEMREFAATADSQGEPSQYQEGDSDNEEDEDLPGEETDDNF